MFTLAYSGFLYPKPINRLARPIPLALICSINYAPPVLEVKDVPCGGPGAVEPVAAGPEVARLKVDVTAPATDISCAGALAVVIDTPAFGEPMPPAPPW